MHNLQQSGNDLVSEINSSRISTVRLTDDFNTYESRESVQKPSQLDKFANFLNAGSFGSSERTDFGLDSLNGQSKTPKNPLMVQIEKNLQMKLLNMSKKTGLRGYRKLQTTISNSARQNKIMNKFSIDYIMRSFDVDKLKVLRDKFVSKQVVNSDGFALIEFVDLMKKVIPYEHPNEECDLVHGLCLLFNEIDINGNGYMEWDEFTGFLIEAVDQKQLQRSQFALTNKEITTESVIDHHLLKIEESQPDYLHTHNMLQVARSQIFQHFNLSSNFKDHLVRNMPIIRAILFHETDTFITLEHRAKSVKLLTAMSNQAIPSITNSPNQQTRIVDQIHLPSPGSNYILSVAFNEKDNVIALCCTDSLIYFYRRYGNLNDWKLFKIICSHGITVQVNMWYLKHHDIWVSIGSQQKGAYTRKQLTTGAIQTLHQWRIPRNKWVADKQMSCEECQLGWNRNRTSGSSNTEYCIERPFIDIIDHTGKKVQSRNQSYIEVPFEHMDHRDDVKDVKEMQHPFLAIITACHDGKLRIISTKMKRIVGILHSGHSTGVRQIDYTPYHGAAIISTGYENYFNVWEIDNSQSFGKQMLDNPVQFKMLKSPCISANFLGQSCFCIGIDKQFIVKIWNYRKRQLMQSLQTSSLKLRDTISGLLVFSEGKIAVLSKNITFYDTITNKANSTDGPNYALKPNELDIRRTILREKGVSEIDQAAIQQRHCMIAPPIDVVFLESYKNFLVLTKDSIRVYHGNSGRLRMYLDNIVETEERTQSLSELTSMSLNSEHRMVYVGNIHGGISCFNVNTGLLIKKLQLDHKISQKQGELNPKINKEICQMQYLNISEEHQFLVSAQWNSRVRVWDVAEIEEANHMRSVSAQKQFNEDIQCVAVSEHLSLVATGSVAGKILVWDLELLKCEGVLIAAKQAIVAMQFVDKFPMLISASECGILSVFSVRGSPALLRRLCMGRFLNVSPDSFGNMINTGISGMVFEVVPNPRYNPKEDPLGELAQNIQLFKMHQMMTRKAKGKVIEKEINNYTRAIFRARLDYSFDTYTTVFSQESPFKDSNDDKFESRSRPKQTDQHQSKDPDEGEFKCADQQKLYQKFYPPFSNSQNPEFLNVVVSDDSGAIKWFDLTTFLRQDDKIEHTDEELHEMAENIQQSQAPCYFKRCQRYSDSKMGFMPSRRMNSEAGSLAQSLYELAMRRKLPPLVLAAQSVQSHQIKNAHKGRINNIRRISVDPYGFVTCGNDKFVRIWSKNGMKVGEINLIKENSNLNDWKFGYDWDKKQRDDEQRASEIVKNLKMTTIHETYTEHQSQNTLQDEGEVNETLSQQKHNQIVSAIKSPKAREFKMSYSRPALDNLVKNPSHEQKEKNDLNTYNRLHGIQKPSPVNKNQSQLANDNIKQIQSMFPIKTLADQQNQVSNLEKEKIEEQNKFINDMIQKQIPGQNPLLINARQTQSSQANGVRNHAKAFSGIITKSSFKDKNLKADFRQKSMISFKINTPDIATDQQSEQNTLKSFKPAIPLLNCDSTKKGISDLTPSDSESSETNNTISALPAHFRKTISSTEERQAQRIDQMNQSENTRLNLFKKKTVSKKLQELTGRSNAQIEKKTKESKQFKILEAQQEKVTQRSVSTLNSLKESTDRTSASRERWQRKPEPRHTYTNDFTESINSLNKTSQASHMHRKSHASTQKLGKSDSITDIKKQIVEMAKEKTDQHLKSLMVECETRHKQMQEYMEQRETEFLGVSKSVPQFHGELKDIMIRKSGSITLQSGHDKSRESELNPQRTSDRPPKARNSAFHMRAGRNQQDQATKSIGAQVAQTPERRSHFLNKVNRYLNENSSNAVLDERLMMHKSRSQADFNNKDSLNASINTGGNSMNVTKNVQAFDWHRKSHVSLTAAGKLAVHQQSQSQLSSGGVDMNGQRRDIQKFIAKQISQKTFKRPDSVIQLNKAIIDFGQKLDSDNQAQTEREKKQLDMANHRKIHMRSSVGQAKASAAIAAKDRPGRVAKFLEKFYKDQQQQSQISK